ncbi:hypothetical protein KI387_025560, partial [Taxus chinensis]
GIPHFRFTVASSEVQRHSRDRKRIEEDTQRHLIGGFLVIFADQGAHGCPYPSP